MRRWVLSPAGSKAEIAILDNLSAHADSEELLGYLKQIKGIKKVILNH